MATEPPRSTDSRTLSTEAETHRAAAQDVMDAMDRHGFGEAACFAVRLSLEEAIVNAFKHGSRGIDDPLVSLAWTVSEAAITISVTDPGPGFNPEGVPDPTSPDRLELPTGRGLMLMKAYMSEVAYNDRGNEVTMTYRKDAPPQRDDD